MTPRLWRLVTADDLPRLSRRSDVGHLVQQDPRGGGWLVTDRTKQLLERQRVRFVAHTADDARWATAVARLIYSWNAAVAPALSDDVALEATLWLYARPDVQLEYMGRGRFLNKLPCNPRDLVYLDIAGGRRAYAFRTLRVPAGQLDERGLRVRADLEERQRWFTDPDARVVLSIGGGGYRLFAALQALKIIEHMLGGDRTRVHEAWGSSGGALLGYVFARGLPLETIENLAYDLYHGRRKDVAGIHLRSLFHFGARVLGDLARGRTGAPELASWVDAVDGNGANGKPTIPFYAMVSNTRWRHPVAFAEPENIAAHTRDFLIPCNSRDATAASMAVPFLFRPLRNVAGFPDDIWFDGSIADENPLMLPFVKWLRDRKAAPEQTPKRLKIVLVNLNLRMSESTFLVGLGARSAIGKAMDVIDLLLDSKTHALIRTLTEVDDVEIMTATLTLGSLNFITRAAIPAAVRTGQIFEGWKLDLHARGR